MSVRDRLVDWLFPVLRETVDQHTFMLEANFDIHCLDLPAGAVIWEEAMANCEALHEDLLAGKVDRRGRAMSLIEVLKRKNIIKRREM